MEVGSVWLILFDLPLLCIGIALSNVQIQEYEDLVNMVLTIWILGITSYWSFLIMLGTFNDYNTI